jgi:RimJ/RimL family protein N-acetyltransferase
VTDAPTTSPNLGPDMTDAAKAPALEPPRGLSDGVVTVRPLLPADAPAFAGAFREDPTLGMMLGLETDTTEADVLRQAVEEPAPGRLPSLAIADAGSLEFLGSIGLYRIDQHNRRAEVGFWLLPSARGRGLATRAVRLVTGWALESLGFHRVEITTAPDNAATRRLAAGLGFVEEGVMTERNLERGRRVDVVMLAMLRHEWKG